MPPSHEEVLQATEARANDMREYVSQICARMPTDLPDTTVGRLFSKGQLPKAGVAAAAPSASAGAPLAVNIFVALVGGLVGGVIGSYLFRRKW